MSNSVRNLTNYMNRCMEQYNVTANNLSNSQTQGFKKNLAIERGGQVNTSVDMSPGAYKSTGNPMDLAIKGNGYFAVRTQKGIRFTRNGSFKLDEQQRIVTQTGDLVLNKQLQPVEINGTPAFTQDGGVYSQGEMIGKLAIVKPGDPTTVTSFEKGYVKFDPEVALNTDYTIEIETLEDSNVDPLKEMTDSIETLRSFSLAERVLKIVQEKSAAEIGRT